VAAKTPLHVGIIPDGNRRWARLHRVPVATAYEVGYNRIISIVDSLYDIGVRYVTVYAASLENCERRSRLERSLLARLAVRAIERLRRDPRVERGEVRVLVMGKPCLLGDNVARAARSINLETRWGEPRILAVLLCYSDRLENWRVSRGMLAEASLHLPPIDLVIRTGGYKRLSGFALPLTGYSELYVTPTLWPDFDRSELEKALAWYAGVVRNFGR